MGVVHPATSAAKANPIKHFFIFLSFLFQIIVTAAQNFWQDGPDPYSISSFVFGILVCAVLLIKPQ